MRQHPEDAAPPDTRELPEEAFALALASLPGAGPAGLRAALDRRGPRVAWGAVLDGVVERPPPRRGANPEAGQLALPGTRAACAATPRLIAWHEAAVRWDVGERWWAAHAAGIELTWHGDVRYPRRLAQDPEAPPILAWRGDLRCLDGPTVAIVGTRHCTPGGRAVARDMARELAGAGVCVVSGLALGIDGAAHRGALEAEHLGAVTAGVAASGVNVPYPPSHRELWEQVVARGVVVSETAPGRPAQAWRFPARNRIIAGLADVVVVVESFEAGGSMLTVDAALARGVEVRAVPGPVHSPASGGTNRLLLDGAGPVRHARDVLDALGIDHASPAPATGRGAGSGGAAGSGHAPLAPGDQRVLDAVGWAPTLLGRIVERSGCSVGGAIAALSRLEECGLVIAGNSWWVRRPRD